MRVRRSRRLPLALILALGHSISVINIRLKGLKHTYLYENDLIQWRRWLITMWIDLP